MKALINILLALIAITCLVSCSERTGVGEVSMYSSGRFRSIDVCPHGRWKWDTDVKSYRWTEGKWIHVRKRKEWVEGRWVQTRRGWRHVDA